MSKTEQIVWISRNDGSNQAFHYDEHCACIPDSIRGLDKDIASRTYRPCGVCVGGKAEDDYLFECSGCGTQRRIGSRGVRTLHGCMECDDVTNHERVTE